MRTLKKTLALVLCLAMIAGLCCFGTSAAFADEAEIEYTEAAAVMNAIGVLKGDGTNFNPKGVLTRAEAAVIIAKMLGDGDLKATSSYKDMAGYEWAQSFAAVCEQKGIILGDGKGNFFPGQELTGYQFGLMLCRALGYKPAQEGVEAATYEIGTAALMKKAGLSAAIVGFDGTKGITREEAAALALKALETTMVEYTNPGTSITINGAVISTGASPASKKTWGTTGAGTYDYTTGTYAAAATETVEFCEVYFGKLSKMTGAGYDEDAFGRPGYTWIYGNLPTDQIFVAKTPILTYTTNMQAAPLAAAVAKDLKNYTYGTGATKWVDGYATANNISAASDVAALTDAGTVVEVYADPITKVVSDVVVVNTFVGTVATHVDAVKDADGEITTKEYITITEGATANTDAANSNKFETTAFAEADEAKTVVLYTLAYVDTDATPGRDAYKVQSVAVAEKVENVAVKAYDATSITTDAKYAVSANAGDALDTTPTMTAGATYTYYFDTYGNIIDGIAYTAVNTSINGIVYATGAATGPAVTADGNVYYVKIVNLDGTQETIATTQTFSSAVSGAGFYMMSKDVTTGKMKFEAAADNKLLTADYSYLSKATNELYAADSITIAEAATQVFKTTDSTLTLDNAGKAYLTAGTRYVFINAKNEVQVVTGGISTSIVGAVGDSTYTVLVSKNDTVNYEVEAIIFAGLGYNEVSASDAVVYVNSNSATGVVLAGVAEYSTYDIYALDGTKTTVPMAAQPDANAFYTYKTDASGVYTLTKITTAPALTGTSVYYASNATATTYGTLLTVTDSGADFADKEAASATIIDLDGIVDVTSLKNIVDVADGYLDAGFLFVNGVITTIFVYDVD